MNEFDAEPAVGAALKALREETGESQGTVAKAVGLSQPRLSLYESGARQPSIGTANVLVRHYGVSFDALLDGDELEKAKRAIRGEG